MTKWHSAVAPAAHITAGLLALVGGITLTGPGAVPGASARTIAALGAAGHLRPSPPAASLLTSAQGPNYRPWPRSSAARGPSESWFSTWRDRPTTGREIRRGRLTDEIRRIFHDAGGSWSPPKIRITLVREGRRVSMNTVAKLMAELGLAGQKNHRRRSLTRQTGGRPGLGPPRRHRRRSGPSVVR
ncbi:hypothetical protein GCM10010211_52800 [Streptomyces albospinus]|uniref:HTH-like domain-containing protein n=2 Tax=Streptomyces albospinus TaxID=285515 RepID=A0ABQ2VCJ7_9ACTN|nr:hypothetical protein GCM10010211_52800 [Streptomyces albospinus]